MSGVVGAFWCRSSLSRLENNLKQQKYVRDPIHLLEHNKDQKMRYEKGGHGLANDIKQLAGATRMIGFSVGFTENIALSKSTGKRRKSRRKHRVKKA